SGRTGGSQLRPLYPRSRGRDLLLRLRRTVESGRSPHGGARRAQPHPDRRGSLVLITKGGHMKSKWLWALLGVLALVGVYAGTVLATPPVGVTTSTIGIGRFDPIDS